jgi:general secretion pathway protein J
MRARRWSGGFTLVELLVALLVMALLSLMSWRGLDGMAHTVAQNRERADDVQALQSGLAQWGADLDAQADGMSNVLDWNGQVLRITRRGADPANPALQVVAWTTRGDAGQRQWLRWQSPAVHTRAQWQTAWQQAADWAQTADAAARRSEVPIVPVRDWQIFFYRGDSWSNALSSSDAATNATPDAVRLVLQLAPGYPLGGKITRDWVRSTLGSNKS